METRLLETLTLRNALRSGEESALYRLRRNMAHADKPAPKYENNEC